MTAPLSRTASRASEHAIRVELDPQRGGWVASCTCGWEAKMPHWYKVDAKRDGIEHLNQLTTRKAEHDDEK